jgi:hypothetical protein
MPLFIYFNVYVQIFNPSELNSLKGSKFLESLVKKASNDEDDLNKESSPVQIETKKTPEIKTVVEEIKNSSKIEYSSISKNSSELLFKWNKCFFFFQ